jgi:hypothetical protein
MRFRPPAVGIVAPVVVVLAIGLPLVKLGFLRADTMNSILIMVIACVASIAMLVTQLIVFREDIFMFWK